MLEEARESAEEDRGPGTRVDWRTGKPMVRRDGAFWREHERRRGELGMSVPQYCAANGLALSTYRHRVNGKKRTSANSPPESSRTSASPAFVAVAPRAADAASVVEITLEGMTMRVCGAAAERLLARVMDRLA